MPVAPFHPVVVQGPTDPSALYVWVTWDRNDPAATAYDVYRNGTFLARVAATGDVWSKCAYKDTAVAGSTTYRYTVRALVETAESGSSPVAEVYVRTDADLGPVVSVDAQTGATDAAKINAAIAAAKANGGGVVQLGGTTTTPKSYAIDSETNQVLMDGTRKVVLRGGGMDATFLEVGGGATTNTGNIIAVAINGTFTNLGGLNGSLINVGDRSVVVSSASGLAVGSRVLIEKTYGGDALAIDATAGALQDPCTERDNTHAYDINEVESISGTTVTFKYPWSQQFDPGITWYRMAEATLGTRLGGNGIERLTIRSGATNVKFRTHIQPQYTTDLHLAEVRSLYPNRNHFDVGGDCYKITMVGCEFPDQGPESLTGISKYGVSFWETSNARVVDCTFGTLGSLKARSHIYLAKSQRALLRHCRLYDSSNYAFGEHGYGSRHWICENSYMSVPSGAEACRFGNSSFNFSGPGIIRNIRFVNCPSDIAAWENTYGVRVLDCVSSGSTGTLIRAASWGADKNAPADIDPANYGAMRLSIQRYVATTANRGFNLGSNDVADASLTFPYLGIKDVVVKDCKLQTTDYAIALRGDSARTKRFQVSGTTGTNKYVRPAFVTGDYWAANADGVSFGSPTAVTWTNESFSWEAYDVANSARSAASVTGQGIVVASGSVTTGAVKARPTTSTVVSTGWLSPENAHADDTNYATAEPARAATISSDWRGFGFDGLIPAGAEISSVTVAITWFASVTKADGGPMGSQVYVGGVAKGTELTRAPFTTEATDTYTVPGLTRLDLLDANFAVRVRASRPDATGGAYTASLDVISVTVAYSVGVHRSAAVSGAGVVVAVGRRVTTGVGVVIPGAGQITLTTRKRAIGTARVSAPGIASARGGLPTTLGVAYLEAEGVVAVTNRKGALGQALVDGEGVLAARGSASVVGKANVVAIGSLRASGAKRSFGIALVAGEGVALISDPLPNFPDSPVAPEVARPNLIPTGPESPLSPVSGTEIRVSLGVVHPEGDVEFTEVGVFGLESTDSTEAGGGVKLSIQGMDRSIKIQRDRFREPYIIQPGTNYVEAIKALVRRSLPTTVFRDEPTQHTTPLLQWEFGDDPLEAIADMVASIGYEAFFGGDGAFVLRSAAVVVDDPVWEFIEGDETVVDSLGRGLTREGVYNGVVQRGENRSTDVPPVQAEAWDTDPTSPTYYDPAFPERSSFGAVPLFHVSPFLVTVEQARDAAVARVRTLKGLSEQVTITSRQVPGLEGGDVVRATRARLNLAAVYVIERISLPLRAGMMSVRARERRL